MGGERRQVFGGRTHRAPGAHVEISADQQKKQQHYRSIEIGVRPARDYLEQADPGGDDNGDGNRHVHVDPSCRDGANGRPEERSSRIGDRRQGDERRHPVQQPPRDGLHVGKGARPDGHRQQHHIAAGEPGDCETAQQERFFVRPLAAQGRRIERYGGIAERVEPGNQVAGPCLVCLPAQPHPAGRQVDARIDDAGLAMHGGFDRLDAVPAMHAVDQQVQGLDSTVFVLNIGCGVGTEFGFVDPVGGNPVYRIHSGTCTEYSMR